VAPGLRKILDLIKATPNDQRLLSRYVSLANELSDAERCEAIIEAAGVLATKAPLSAIELAWGLFKSGRLEQEALVTMASAMESLGKSGKAAAIRVDAIRLTSHPVGSKENEDARRRIDTAVGLSQGKPKSQFGVDVVTKTNNNFAVEGSNPPNHPAQNVPSTPPKAEPLVKAIPVKVQEAPVTPAAPPSAASSPAVQTGAAQTPQFDLDAASNAAEDLPKSTAAGIPKAIPPKEPSNHSKAFLSRMARTQSSIGSRDSGVKNSKLASLPSPQDQDACHRYVKDLAEANRWDDILAFIYERFEGLNNPFLIVLFETHSFSKIDIQFFAAWLDILIANHQERRALRLCLQVLNDEPQLSWAKMIRPRIEIIVARLGLQVLDWREAEGVATLRKKISRLQPKTLIYPVLPMIGS
jgi:hypothetical protein